MRPPSARMHKSTIILRFADRPSGSGGTQQPRYAEPGITLRANVSASTEVDATVALKEVASLRCRVMVWEDPEGEDPTGITRKLRKGDGVMYRGRLWIVCGPMTPESLGLDGTPVNWRFEMEAVA